MSFERYANNHNLSREVRNVRQPYESPIGAFAQLFVTDAETELVSFNRGPDSRISSVFTIDRPKKIRRGDLSYTNKMEALIYWGNAIISFEDILRSGEYDHNAYIERVNFSIGKYDGSEVYGEKDLVYRYSDLQIKELANRAQNDPTFSDFIENASLLIPKPLLNLWIKKGVFSQIIDMRKSYKIAAQKVIPRVLADKLEQSLTLREYDSDYRNFIESLKS